MAVAAAIPAMNGINERSMNAGIVKVIINIVYYKYVSGLRYPARGAIGILILVPQTLLT